MNQRRTGDAARRGGANQQSRQQGQALVESAVLLSLLLLLLAGAVDLGGLLDSHLALVYATRQAARVGAEEDQNVGADCAVLGAVLAATQNLSQVTLTQIVIYQADSTGNPTGNEQVYAGNPGCPSPPTPPEGANPATWPPAARQDVPPNEDALGVEIDYTYTWQTGFIATGRFQGTDRTVMRLNPVV